MVENIKADEISEFNEMSLKLQRLHFGWILCNSKRLSGIPHSYRHAVECMVEELWNEINKMDKDKNTTYEKDIENIQKEITKAKSPTEVFNFARKLERKLREVQQLSGLGVSYKNKNSGHM